LSLALVSKDEDVRELYRIFLAAWYPEQLQAVLAIEACEACFAAA